MLHIRPESIRKLNIFLTSFAINPESLLPEAIKELTEHAQALLLDQVQPYFKNHHTIYKLPEYSSLDGKSKYFTLSIKMGFDKI